MAKTLLKKKGVGFTEVDAGESPSLREWLRDATQRHTVPQIFINGRPIGGYQELAQLERSGALDRSLAEEPSSEDPELPGMAPDDPR